jgi:hypothetical protein
MTYSAEVGSGSAIYIPGFIKTGLAIQILMDWGGGGDTPPHRQHGDRTSVLLFVKNKKVR